MQTVRVFFEQTSYSALTACCRRKKSRRETLPELRETMDGADDRDCVRIKVSSKNAQLEIPLDKFFSFVFD